MTVKIEGFTKTWQKKTGCGNLYVSIVYQDDDPSKIDYIKIYGGMKTGDCGGSHLETLADTSTMLLKRIDLNKKSELRLMIKAFRNHRCNRQLITEPKKRIFSCSDAIGRVLQEALDISEEELRG